MYTEQHQITTPINPIPAIIIHPRLRKACTAGAVLVFQFGLAEVIKKIMNKESIDANDPIKLAKDKQMLDAVNKEYQSAWNYAKTHCPRVASIDAMLSAAKLLPSPALI